MLKTALIGCGWIAGLRAKPGGDEVVTHAQAMRADGRFDLRWVHDISGEHARSFTKEWGGETCPSMRELLAHDPQRVVVASSTGAHLEALTAIVKNGKDLAVLCEKPVVGTLEELEKFHQLLKISKVPVLVNFPRRFDEALSRLGARVRSGEFGRLKHFDVLTRQGLAHSGCHALDLLRQWGHPVAQVKMTGLTRKGVRGVEGVWDLVTEGGVLGDITLADLDYGALEMTLTFEEGRIHILNQGHRLLVQRARESRDYPGFRMLEEELCEATLRQAFRDLYRAFANPPADWLMILEGQLKDLELLLKAEMA
ncbi:MAG: Gfo/Idh/MocA family protein [Planctomycetota bacterium]